MPELKGAYTKRVFKRPRYYALTPESILELGNSITDDLAKALFFFVYLTGARINEATDFTPNRIAFMGDRVVIRLKTLKQQTEDSMRKVPIPIGPEAKCHEAEMWKAVSEYLKDFTIQDRPFRKWGNMSVYLRRHVTLITEARIRTVGGDYLDKVIEKPFHPHYLRHARATHLAEYYNFNNQQLCFFFGWTNTDMALIYTKTADVWSAFTKA